MSTGEQQVEVTGQKTSIELQDLLLGMFSNSYLLEPTSVVTASYFFMTYPTYLSKVWYILFYSLSDLALVILVYFGMLQI